MGWALVVGLLVSAAVATLATRGGGARSRLLVLPWILVAVATLGLAVVSWDELDVSQGELDQAVQEVADRLDGATYVLPALELRRQVGEELGHPVDLAALVGTGPDTPERQEAAYDVTPRAEDDGPAMCLTVVVTDAGQMGVSADTGRCEATG